MRLHSLALLVALSCNSEPAIHADGVQLVPGDKSGTRLKLRYYVTADGAEQVVGFFDSARNEKCVFKRAADGVMRCLPDIPLTWAPLTRYYSDPSCTNEVFGLPHGCQVSNVEMRSKTANRCNDGVSVYPLGVAYNGPVYEDDLMSQQCRRANLGGLFAPQDFHVMGPEISPTSFVAAQEVVR